MLDAARRQVQVDLFDVLGVNTVLTDKCQGAIDGGMGNATAGIGQGGATLTFTAASGDVTAEYTLEDITTPVTIGGATSETYVFSVAVSTGATGGRRW